jgi:signal transduction histidine kinase/CheY-like chemotaxis protein
MSASDYSDNGYTAQFLAAREARIDRNISRRILPLSILVAPVLWIGTRTGAFAATNGSLAILFAASVLFSLAAYLMTSHDRFSPAVKYIEVTAAAGLIFYMSVQHYLDLAVAYCIVPLLGCYFLTGSIFGYSLILGYVLMAASLVIRSGYFWNYGYFDSQAAYIFTYVLGYTIEYIFVAIILVVLSQAFQDALARMREQAAMREAERLKNEARSSFLASMAHDIRTPLNAISGYGELIVRSARDDETRLRARQIGAACGSLQDIVNDILDLSSIESGKLNLENEPADMYELLSELNSEAEIAAAEKGLELRFSIDPSVPGTVFCDRRALRRILQNLLSNAIKYTFSGGVTLTVSGAPDREGGAMLNMRVTDTGIGIKSEDLPTLFTDFRRLHDPRSAGVPGTGLGLSICCGLLRAMGSSLEAESVYGGGSSFGFTLRTAKCAPSGPIGDYAARYADEKAGGGEYRPLFTAPGARIMAVDDSDINSDILCALLSDTGMTVDCAASGEECLKLARENYYHVILMDHQMPGMDGVETLRELRRGGASLNPGVKVIALTANVFENARERYLSLGFADYIGKPFQPEQVERSIMACLPAELVEPAD